MTHSLSRRQRSFLKSLPCPFDVYISRQDCHEARIADAPESEGCELGDLFRPDFAMTDGGYRNSVAAGMLPSYVTCPDCGGMATFRTDDLAARYECQRCGHAVAAMWVDPVVAGTKVLR